MGTAVLANLLAVVLLVAIVAFPVLIVAYAVAELAKNRWRFSLRALLIVTTQIAALPSILYSAE